MGCRTTSTNERQMLTVPVARSAPGRTLQYVYDPARQTLTRTKGSTNETLLTGCSSLQFSIFQRSPCSNTFLPYSTSTVTNTKLIELTWNCYRTVMGTKVNTECMQSAKVVIRKK